MTQRDPLDELAARLFAAARDEAPDATVRADTVRSVGAATISPMEETRARSRWLIAAWTVCSLAVAAITLLSVRLPRPPAPPQFPLTPDDSKNPRSTVVGARDGAAEGPTVIGSTETPDASVRSVRRSSSARTREVARASTPASLAVELNVLERARSALTRSDIPGAFQALDEYEHTLRGTQLRAEAALLRIDALIRSGRETEARELARLFDQSFPGSPLSDRARALIPTGTPGPSQSSTSREQP